MLIKCENLVLIIGVINQRRFKQITWIFVLTNPVQCNTLNKCCVQTSLWRIHLWSSTVLVAQIYGIYPLILVTALIPYRSHLSFCWKKIISSQNLFDSWYNIGECELADTILILKLLELLNLCSTLYTLNIIWLKSIGNKIANFILHHNSVPLKGKHFSKEMAMVTVNLGCFLRTLYLHVFYFSENWQTTVDSVLYELFSVDVYHQKHELNLIKVRESKDKMMANLHGFFFLFK